MTMLEERVSSMEGAYEHIATKSDIQELRGDTRTAIQELRGETNTAIEQLRGELNASTEQLRGELNAATERLQGEIEASKQELRAEFVSQIRASETRVVKWVAGMMVGSSLGIITAMAALLRLFLQ